MTKNEYRKLYKRKRLNLTIDERKLMDKNICNSLQSFNWSEVRYVHVYLPLEKFNEPDILAFVSYLRMYYVDINLVISKSNFENNTMENYVWQPNSLLVENKWGILEPSSGKLVRPRDIDVVIVPLLVADVNGNRVGYGKGFYDRFLAECNSEVRTIGVSYFEPVFEIDDVEDWDFPIDILVTGSSIYNFLSAE